MIAVERAEFCGKTHTLEIYLKLVEVCMPSKTVLA